MTDAQKLTERERQIEAVIALCSRYGHPGVNPATHALAVKVLQIFGVREVGK